MPERVRQAVFEKVGSQWGTLGALPPVRVLDVFSGAGGIGLEALSRGAVWCGFVERDGNALKAMRQNVAAILGREGDTLTQILRADAFRFESWREKLRHGPIDLASFDPPFSASRDASLDGRMGRVLVSLGRGDLLAEDAIVIVRHESSIDYDQEPYGNLRAFDARRYGGMTVTFLTNAEGQ
jgi:16S rRNA (guanine966-N2)-methyltransferase